MQFNKDALRALLALDDHALWDQIRTIAASGGVTLPDGAPPKEDIARLRAALGSASASDVAGAMKIIDDYRNGRK